MSQEELKTFPISQIRPTAASFRGNLAYNPYSGLPPTIWYSVGVDLEKIDLAEDAPAPDIWGTTVDTTLCLGGIALPFRDWREIDGTFGPIEDAGESSVYVSDIHNPIDIRSVRFNRLDGVRFKIDFDLYISFEFEGAGFRDTTCAISVEADFEGISFAVPNWNNPDSVEFPEDWNIPADFTASNVNKLFERFVDTRLYSLEKDGRYYGLKPCLAKAREE